jgi:hypothetical protein
MRESTVEDALIARVKALGGECRKVKWVGRNGAPDQLVMLPEVRQKYSHDGPNGRTYHSRVMRPVTTVWVELKAPKKGPRPRQVNEHESMRALGQTVLVINSLELIDVHFPLN